MLAKGFMEGYTRWICHGEETEVANEAEVVEFVEDGHVAIEEEANSKSSGEDNMGNLDDMLHDMEERRRTRRMEESSKSL